MRYLYTSVFTPQEDGRGYRAEIPDLPHCVTSGRDLADALDQISDAAALMLTCLEDDGQPIPAPTSPDRVAVPDGCVSSLVSLDTDRYRILNNTRAVRKNVSLPEWMATMAERRGINCSQVLQDALRNMLT